MLGTRFTLMIFVLISDWSRLKIFKTKKSQPLSDAIGSLYIGVLTILDNNINMSL